MTKHGTIEEREIIEEINFIKKSIILHGKAIGLLDSALDVVDSNEELDIKSLRKVMNMYALEMEKLNEL